MKTEDNIMKELFNYSITWNTQFGEHSAQIIVGQMGDISYWKVGPGTIIDYGDGSPVTGDGSAWIGPNNEPICPECFSDNIEYEDNGDWGECVCKDCGGSTSDVGYVYFDSLVDIFGYDKLIKKL